MNLADLFRAIWIRRGRTDLPRILILTPVKDASPFLSGYFKLLLNLSYPKDLVSVGLLESDSRDRTVEILHRRLPGLRWAFRRVQWWKKDFGFQLARNVPRWTESIQTERRVTLARSRNHLLARALDDEDWVLWLDVDVIGYPEDILQRLLATGKDIVQPHCVAPPDGRSFDRNAWRFEDRRRYMEEMRGEGDLVKLDSVGGTMLLVRADLHRDGLIFPAFNYRGQTQDPQPGYPETEGLGMMASDMGYQCWGMPNLEISHNNW